MSFKIMPWIGISFRVLGMAVLAASCDVRHPAPWTGPVMGEPRDRLMVGQLLADSVQPFLDMSYFKKPGWSQHSSVSFSGSLVIPDTEMIFPKDRNSYDGEDLFPAITIGFVSHRDELIPLRKEKIITSLQSKSLWDVVVGVGRVWHEAQDGRWSRASFPVTLTDRYIGQARNCVGTFVYQADSISNICFQCSQETADLNDHQVGDIRAMLNARYHPTSFIDSVRVIAGHLQWKSQRLPVHELRAIDSRQEVAEYFDKELFTNAPTSLGAVVVDNRLYMHPARTRHGLYPYPSEMRHGVYSVTKSMAGALALLYFAQRYGDGIFDALITDHVPALAHHPGWKDVTFSHALNMVTGTVGSERAEHLLHVLVLPRTADESIRNIANLGDSPERPGEKFNYASTNLFVLSVALQHYVEEKEGKGVYYWDLVRQNVLIPIGAEYFSVLHTVEADSVRSLPRLAYGALPTIDEATKISMLFGNEGKYRGRQLLHLEKTREALGRTSWKGYDTDNDDRGDAYRHSFWSTTIETDACPVSVSYMLGYGANDVLFLANGVIIFRFMDEYDLDFGQLVQGVEHIKSSCGGEN